MKRIGFLLKVREDKLQEYKERHKTVWPEMLDALRRTGWHNYSLFLRQDGLLFGYFETPESFETALRGMAKEEVNRRMLRRSGALGRTSELQRSCSSPPPTSTVPTSITSHPSPPSPFVSVSRTRYSQLAVGCSSRIKPRVIRPSPDGMTSGLHATPKQSVLNDRYRG